MNGSRSPNYVLSYEHVMETRGDSVTLPVGAFVRPVMLQYVPKHVIEDKRYTMFNDEREVFCYTRYGFTPIPRFKIRQT